MFKFILGFITSQARVSTERKFREKVRKFSVAFRKLFREISHFFAFRNKAKFSGFFFQNSHFFRKIFAFSISQNLAFFRKTDWSEISRTKAKIFAFFASKRNAKMKQNGRQKFFI